MQLQTDNREVGTLVSDATKDVQNYRKTKQRSYLHEASDKLKLARSLDHEYLQALYARALVDDLDGRSSDAVEELRRVLADAPPFADEVEYHLAAALYHRFNWPSLDEAITRLRAVLARTARTGDALLACRARVKLVQALGMRMIPRDPRNADLAEIDRYFQQLQEQAAAAGDALRAFPGTDGQTARELRSTLHNAKGLAAMYWSDFFGSDSQKLDSLQNALRELEYADSQNPDDWGIHCDIGSTWMRLGHWTRADDHFARALAHLDRVTTTLRPGYGFAIYEAGRACRLAGRFAEALGHFDRALEIPYEYRDVSDRRLTLEKARAQAASTEYP